MNDDPGGDGESSDLAGEDACFLSGDGSFLFGCGCERNCALGPLPTSTNNGPEFEVDQADQLA